MKALIALIFGKRSPLLASPSTAGPGCKCPACGLTFTRCDVRNMHYMRKHADRRKLVS